MTRALLALALGLVLAALAGCSSDDERPGVVATTTQVGDLVRQVAGERMPVRQILRPGSDPHEYEPRPSDALALLHARLVVRSGGDVDSWLSGLVERSGSHARTLTLLDVVRRDGSDPHWWQDPRNAESAVIATRDALIATDPGGASAYRANAARYLGTLRTLDAGIRRCVAQIPPARRRLVTSHDSLGYYARRYGFTVVGAAVPALSSQAQPSAAATERLVRQIRAQHVPAIFPESALNPKLERAIAREAGARVAPPLWADALGPKGSSGATYVDSLRANTRSIVRALGGPGAKCDL